MYNASVNNTTSNVQNFSLAGSEWRSFVQDHRILTWNMTSVQVRDLDGAVLADVAVPLDGRVVGLSDDEVVMHRHGELQWIGVDGGIVDRLDLPVLDGFEATCDDRNRRRHVLVDEDRVIVLGWNRTAAQADETAPQSMHLTVASRVGTVIEHIEWKGSITVADGRQLATRGMRNQSDSVPGWYRGTNLLLTSRDGTTAGLLHEHRPEPGHETTELLSWSAADGWVALPGTTKPWNNPGPDGTSEGVAGLVDDEVVAPGSLARIVEDASVLGRGWSRTGDHLVTDGVPVIVAHPPLPPGHWVEGRVLEIWDGTTGETTEIVLADSEEWYLDDAHRCQGARMRVDEMARQVAGAEHVVIEEGRGFASIHRVDGSLVGRFAVPCEGWFVGFDGEIPAIPVDRHIELVNRLSWRRVPLPAWYAHDVPGASDKGSASVVRAGWSGSPQVHVVGDRVLSIGVDHAEARLNVTMMVSDLAGRVLCQMSWNETLALGDGVERSDPRPLRVRRLLPPSRGCTVTILGFDGTTALLSIAGLKPVHDGTMMIYPYGMTALFIWSAAGSHEVVVEEQGFSIEPTPDHWMDQEGESPVPAAGMMMWPLQFESGGGRPIDDVVKLVVHAGDPVDINGSNEEVLPSLFQASCYGRLVGETADGEFIEPAWHSHTSMASQSQVGTCRRPSISGRCHRGRCSAIRSSLRWRMIVRRCWV